MTQLYEQAGVVVTFILICIVSFVLEKKREAFEEKRMEETVNYAELKTGKS